MDESKTYILDNNKVIKFIPWLIFLMAASMAALPVFSG